MTMEVRPYDVKLNGKGYLLRRGSYQKGRLPVNYDRFSTGQVEYSDLTDQEAWAQSDWRGGFNQKAAVRGFGKFFESSNIEVMDDEGSFRLAKPFDKSYDEVDVDASVRVRYSYDSGTTDTMFAKGMNGNSGKLMYTTDMSTWNSAVNLSGTITDMVVYNAKIYVTDVDNKIYWASSDPTAAGSWTADFTTSYAVAWRLQEVLGNDIYVTNNGAILRKYDGTGVGGETQVIQSNQWVPIAMCEHNGRLYMGCRDKKNRNMLALRVYDGSVDWTIQRWENATDDFAFNVMVSFNGKLYFSMNYTKLTTSRLYSFDGEKVEIEMEFDPTRPSYYSGKFDYETVSDDSSYIDSVSIVDAEISNGKLFVLVKVAGSTVASTGWAEIYCNPGGYWYRYKRFDEGEVISDANYGVTSLLGTEKELLMFVATGPGAEYDSYRTCFTGNHFEVSGELKSSVLDMDLFSVDKRLNSLESYHATMPASATVTNKIVTFGEATTTATTTNSTTDSELTVLKLDSDNTGKKFQYVVELSTGQYSPIVSDVVARYVIDPDFKRAWTFEVLVEDNMERRDGTREPRTAKQIMRDIDKAAEKNIVSFLDVDDEYYDPLDPDSDNRGVRIREYQVSGPFPFGGDGPEFVVQFTVSEL